MASRSRILLQSRRVQASLCSNALRPAFRLSVPPRIQVRNASATGAAVKPQVKLTTEQYPELKRDSRFAQLTSAHVDHFKSIVGDNPSAIINGLEGDADADLEGYNGDWMRKYRGQSRLVLRPSSTDEVSRILAYCNQEKLAIVPQGGNTGLVGGSVPVFDEVVLSLGRMNKIRSFDKVSGTLVVDAGVVLETADQYLAERGYIFPLDLGAKGSCHIGGNIATNAGGLRLLRYGSLHGNVLGIEAVLPDGTVVDDLVTLRKNNTGYDLKQLFIGAEGTIGVVTAAAIACPQRSPAVNVALFGLESYEKVQEAFVKAKGQLAEILSAFELMDAASQKLVHSVTQKSPPLEGGAGAYPFYVLIETSGSSAEHDGAKLEAFVEKLMEEGTVVDGTLAQDETQIRALWGWREGIPESLAADGGVYKYDVSIPIAELYSLVDDTRAMLKEKNLIGDSEDFPASDVVGYGHMGDQNLHLNVKVRRYDKAVEKALEPWVFEWIKQRKGSISAEHGLGLAKKPFVGYSRNETVLKVMKSVKNLFDPNGIMNPYKYL